MLWGFGLDGEILHGRVCHPPAGKGLAPFVSSSTSPWCPGLSGLLPCSSGHARPGPESGPPPSLVASGQRVGVPTAVDGILITWAGVVSRFRLHTG